MATIRPPKHIRDLASLGKTMADLSAFRFQLSAFRITCCWSDSRRAWMLGKVPKSGPTFVSLTVPTAVLVDLMADPLDIARQFESQCQPA